MNSLLGLLKTSIQIQQEVLDIIRVNTIYPNLFLAKR